MWDLEKLRPLLTLRQPAPARRGGNVESLVWDGREVWGTVGAGACGGVGAAADDGRRGVKGGAGAACGQAVAGPLGRNTRRRWGRLSRGRGRGRLVRV